MVIEDESGRWGSIPFPCLEGRPTNLQCMQDVVWSSSSIHSELCDVLVMSAGDGSGVGTVLESVEEIVRSTNALVSKATDL